jgi:hypothetical protein
VSKRWVLITIRLGFVIIYLNQSSERNMIDIPGCSERTNFKSLSVNFAKNCGFHESIGLVLRYKQV